MKRLWHEHSLTIVLVSLTVLLHMLYTVAWYYSWKYTEGFAAEWSAGFGAAIVVILATRKGREKLIEEDKDA